MPIVKIGKSFEQRINGAKDRTWCSHTSVFLLKEGRRLKRAYDPPPYKVSRIQLHLFINCHHQPGS